MQDYKIKAFADDVLLIVEYLENSIKAIVDILEQYCEWAGLKVNNKKTQILCKKHVTDTNEQVRGEI